ncbi:MAG: ExbD/TolR family protein [Gammaproteobacteria bacterium]|jgi:biopolymer transport protein ExbD|nr:MAG: biopolymer transporter ExbD [Gammaproteobacteria bacterium]|tara:strand:- start:10091 stop:10501 length:411 start_codon:yes stop_codon:yes gene_type:complete
MKFLKKKNTELSLEVTPLIDIVFLLLIFFVLNSQFDKLTTMELSLPEVNSNQLKGLAEENLIIEINSAEEVILNGERLNEFSYTSLNDFIINNYPDNKKAVISADSDTRYQYLVTVMDVLNKNNFDSVEINATELK